MRTTVSGNNPYDRNMQSKEGEVTLELSKVNKKRGIKT